MKEKCVTKEDLNKYFQKRNEKIFHAILGIALFLALILIPYFFGKNEGCVQLKYALEKTTGVYPAQVMCSDL